MLYLKGKLTEDEADVLGELVNSEGFVVLVEKLLPMLLEARAERVLTQTLAEQQDLLKLALSRAELDGARKLSTDIGKLKELSKRKTSAPSR